MALTIASSTTVPRISTNTTWSLVTADGTTGANPLELPGAADKTVQVSNIGATGAVVAIEGSLDKLSWFTLRDTQGNNLSFSADGIKSVLETVNYVVAAGLAGAAFMFRFEPMAAAPGMGQLVWDRWEQRSCLVVTFKGMICKQADLNQLQ